jgi:hypothetical protein
MQAFETVMSLRRAFLLPEGEGKDEGQFKLTPSPQSSPVEGEEAERSNFRHDGAR